MIRAGIGCAALLTVVACGRAPRSEGGAGDRETPRAVGDGGATDARAAAGTVKDAAPAADANREIEDAIAGLWSEHPEHDVRSPDWWREHADQVRPRLAAMLEDGNDDGQGDRWAMRILGDLGHPDDVPMLSTVVTSWPGMAKERAAAALAAHVAPAALAALVELTGSDDDEIVAAAASGLATRADEATRGRFEALLDHRDEGVRYQAARGLVAIGGDASRAALERRKKVEKDQDVRAMIAKGLKRDR